MTIKKSAWKTLIAVMAIGTLLAMLPACDGDNSATTTTPPAGTTTAPTTTPPTTTPPTTTPPTTTPPTTTPPPATTPPGPVTAIEHVKLTGAISSIAAGT